MLLFFLHLLQFDVITCDPCCGNVIHPTLHHSTHTRTPQHDPKHTPHSMIPHTHTTARSHTRTPQHDPTPPPHSTIPPEELQELSELFTSIDEEGTGTITYDQLRASLDMAGCQVCTALDTLQPVVQVSVMWCQSCGMTCNQWRRGKHTLKGA